jgi:hypothetical protein
MGCLPFTTYQLVQDFATIHSITNGFLAGFPQLPMPSLDEGVTHCYAVGW